MRDLSFGNLVNLKRKVRDVEDKVSGAESEQGLMDIVNSTVAIYRNICDSGCYSYVHQQAHREDAVWNREDSIIESSIDDVVGSFDSLLGRVAGRVKDAAVSVSDSLSRADDERSRRKLSRSLGIYAFLTAGVVQSKEYHFNYLLDEEIDSCMAFNKSLLSLVDRYNAILGSYLASDIRASVVSVKYREIISLRDEVRKLPDGFEKRGKFDYSYDVGAWVDCISQFADELKGLGKDKRREKVARERTLVDRHISYYSEVVRNLEVVQADSSEKYLSHLAKLSSAMQSIDLVDFSKLEAVMYVSSRKSCYESAKKDASIIVGTKKAEAEALLLGEFDSISNLSSKSGDDSKDLVYFRQKLADFDDLKRRYVILFQEPVFFSAFGRNLAERITRAESAVAVKQNQDDISAKRSHVENLERIRADKEVAVAREAASNRYSALESQLRSVREASLATHLELKRDIADIAAEQRRMCEKLAALSEGISYGQPAQSGYVLPNPRRFVPVIVSGPASVPEDYKVFTDDIFPSSPTTHRTVELRKVLIGRKSDDVIPLGNRFRVASELISGMDSPTGEEKEYLRLVKSAIESSARCGNLGSDIEAGKLDKDLVYRTVRAINSLAS